jgi:hypothetical protein
MMVLGVELELDLSISEGVVPARRGDRKEPRGEAGLLPGVEVPVSDRGVMGNGWIGRARGKIEPSERSQVAVEDIVGPGELKHDIEIAGVGLVGSLEVLQGVLDIAGLDGAFGHDFGVERGRRRSGRRARPADLGKTEHGADPIGQVVVIAGKHTIEEGLGGNVLAMAIEQEPELGGG